MRYLYTIYDNKANEIFGTMIFIQTHNAVAIRQFQDSMTAQNSILAKYPTDFDLVCLGELNPDTQHILPRWEVIMTGSALAAMMTKDADPPAPKLAVARGD